MFLQGSAFLPWHRYFMLKWEAEIREFVANDSGFVLPYWDWTNKEDCDVCVDSIMGGINSENRTLISPEYSFVRFSTYITFSRGHILKRGRVWSLSVRLIGSYIWTKQCQILLHNRFDTMSCFIQNILMPYCETKKLRLSLWKNFCSLVGLWWPSTGLCTTRGSLQQIKKINYLYVFITVLSMYCIILERTARF